MADLYYKDPVAIAPLKMKSRQLAEAIIPAHDVEKLPGTVEADIAASKARLDAINAAQGAPGAIYGGTKTVTTPGTRVVLGASQALTEGVQLRGLDTNAQVVYAGNASVSSTGNGTRLSAKEPLFIRCNNVNLIYLDAAVAGEGVTWIGW
jgi:hypothetical protein